MALLLLASPLVFVVAAWAAARISVARSRLDISSEGARVANHRRPVVTVPLDEVDRFEPAPRTGLLAGLTPSTCVLIRRDGGRVPVRGVTAPGAGVGVDALNARLDALRSDPQASA